MAPGHCRICKERRTVLLYVKVKLGEARNSIWMCRGCAKTWGAMSGRTA